MNIDESDFNIHFLRRCLNRLVDAYESELYANESISIERQIQVLDMAFRVSNYITGLKHNED
jgi:hypothetical protein